MNYDSIIINDVVLKQSYNYLLNDYEKFKLVYEYLNNSYIKRTNNIITDNMFYYLKNQYDVIDKQYKKVINYLDKYIKTINSIDLKLINNSNYIENSVIRNYIDSKLQLPNDN